MFRWVVLALLLPASAALAQEQQRAAAFVSWAVFADPPGPRQMCWAAASAEGGSPEMMVNEPLIFFDTGSGQFSITLRRGEFRADRGTLSLGERAFELFFEGATGWLRDEAEDRRMLAAVGEAILADRVLSRRGRGPPAVREAAARLIQRKAGVTVVWRF